MKKIIFAMVMALGLCGCSSDLDEKGGTGSIAGSVSDMTTGEPVATVNVTLSPGGVATVTGSDGGFMFDNLNPGDYSIEIRKEGYKPNAGSVEVKGGQVSQTHLLIDRIPAVIIADRDMLQFGAELTTLSFTIVNRGYTDMSYRIETGNCSWMSVDPQEGVLGYGKTATIVVNIDRSLLASGNNEAMIVVRSMNGGGNTEVKVIAEGEYRAQSAVNTLPASDVTKSSACLNGEIINEGAPMYTERGFVWDTRQEMSLTSNLGTISVPVNENRQFSCKIEHLTPTTTYYARAYCIQKGAVIYGNVVAFSMSHQTTELTTSAVTNITANTATLNASISNAGQPAYSERGFCYGTDSEPTVANNRRQVSGSGAGSFTLNIDGLMSPATYYVRAYAIQSGVPVYGNVVSFNTANEPVSITTSAVSGLSASSVTLNATIANAGQPTYSERGFCYAIDIEPTIQSNRKRVSGTGAGAYSVTLNGLDCPATYYVKAYAIQNGQPVYGNMVIFSTQDRPVELVTSAATGITESGATLNGTVIYEGDPACTMRGFVYSNSNSNPTYSDHKVVDYNNYAGVLKKEVSGLMPGSTYYYRIFAMQNGEPVYGNVMTFTTNALPEVRTDGVTNIKGVDMGLGIVMEYTAQFNGTVIDAGQPPYTERGFVWDTTSSPTVGMGTKVSVSGRGIGAFHANVTGLPTMQTIYMRAYVKTKSGYVYGENVSFSTY